MSVPRRRKMHQKSKINSVATLCLIAIGVFITALPLTCTADVNIEPGLDVWETDPCDGAVDLPALPEGFFGPGSLATEACPDFLLEGYPYPDICGPPNPFPKNEYHLQITWRDQHGNTVSSDSRHRVTGNVRRIIPSPPYNFDTIVERGTKHGAEPDPALSFQNVGDERMGNITFCWLSLKGCEKKEVRFRDGSTKLFEVFICLSDTPQVSGRMKFTARDVRDGGGAGLVDLGDSADRAASEFEAGNFNFFDQDPDALGLPLFYKVVFRDCEDPDNRFVIDDPDGTQTGVKTTVLWNHDPPEGSEEGDGEWEVRAPGQLLVPEGHDYWRTPPGGAAINLPTLGPGFFGFAEGNPSRPIPGGVIEFEGWPFDFPAVPLGVGRRLTDRFVLGGNWTFQNVNIVGPDSIHQFDPIGGGEVRHVEPRSYDTVVRRGGASFGSPEETQDVPIEIVELSLRSVEPVEVSFQQGPNRFFDVFVTLSDNFEAAQQNYLRARGQPFVDRRNMQGRMRMTANKVDEAGGEVGLDIGDVEPGGFDLLFENLLDSAQPFDQEFGFGENPGALGLPVAYQLLFFERDPESGEPMDHDPETPEIDPANDIDSPFGELGVFTTALFHNQQGGTFQSFQWQPGDMNGDGVVDRHDIDPFIFAREDPAGYKDQFGAEPAIVADVNGDGVADEADIDAFIQTALGERNIGDFWKERDPTVFCTPVEPVFSDRHALIADVIRDAGRVTEVEKEDDELILRWGSIPGRRYVFEFSEDLIEWRPLPGEFIAVDQESEIRLPVPKTDEGFVRPSD